LFLPTELKTYDLLSPPISSHLQGHTDTHTHTHTHTCVMERQSNQVCVSKGVKNQVGVLLNYTESCAVFHAGVQNVLLSCW